MRAKRPAVPAPAPQPVLPPTTQQRAWELVFAAQRRPVLRSELVTALIQGTQLPVERLPTEALADAVLLATAAREHCGAEIVVDYPALLSRMEDTFTRPDFCTRVCDTAFINKVSHVCWHGSSPFVCVEQQCVPVLVEWLLNQDQVPEYFTKEISR